MTAKGRLGDILVANKLITPQDLEVALQEQKEKGGFLGQILINKGLASPSDIEKALQQLSSGTKERTELGQMLLSEKVILEEQLKTALERQKATKQNLDDILIELGYVNADQIAEVLSRHLGLPFVKLTDYPIRQDLLSLVPENYVRNNHVVPIALEEDTLLVAMSDPLNLVVLDQLRLTSTYKIKSVIATKKDILAILEKYFNLQQMAKQLLADIRLDKVSDDTYASRLADTIFQAGVESRASDIHFEPQFPEMRVRFRVDGILRDIVNIPKSIEPAVISRIKVLADMDITEHRRPQDGHMTTKFKNKEYDLRIASTSTVSGEKIVVRILDKTGMLLGLNELGLNNKDQDVLRLLISRPYGIILVTGPTGSGKTTSLYAVLNQMDTMSKNVITIEDPVEYRIEGINQMQVNPTANITFATGLRSILRQDPDVIMVGEIRDLETATIAIHAALTGHLVFSTLHTNDASSAVTRLIDMGVEPFLISSSLIGVVAQRLVRNVCSVCKEPYHPDLSELRELGLPEQSDQFNFIRPKGCQACLGTGYKGRTGIFEVMNVSERIQELVLQRQAAGKIKEIAVQEGMTTLKNAAIEKVIKGVSSFQEIKRVILS